MTNSAPTAPNPSGQDQARGLQERLQTVFQSNITPREKRSEAFAKLGEDFAAGLYGGVPLKGDAPSALLKILDQLEWPVSVEKLARCAPHFPMQFTHIELSECLARLGYHGREFSSRLNALSAKKLPVIAVHGNHISIISIAEDGSFQATDPTTGEVRTLNKGKRLKLISFAQKIATSSDSDQTKSWLAATLVRFRSEIVELFAMTAVINVMVLVVSFAVMSIYDKVIPAAAYDTLFAICIGIALAAGIEMVFRWLKARLIGRLTGRLEFLLGSAIFSKLISLPMTMVTRTPVVDQISRLRQFENVRDLFSGPFVAVGLELPFVALFTIGLFAVGGVLGFVPVVLMIVYALIGMMLIGPVRRQTQKASKLRREQYQSVLETVSNMRHIRSIGCEDVWLRRLDEKTEESAIAKRHADRSQRFLTTVASAAVPIAGASTVVLGALLVMEGTLTVGMLIGTMIVVWRVLAPIQQLFLMLSRYTEMQQMIGQVNSMMRLPSVGDAHYQPVRRSFVGQISFDRVSFRYQGSSHTNVQSISFAIEPNELIAIQGHSGAGKSTILRLILDLYQPQAGSVQIDGINVQQIPATDLRSAIGYVPQQPGLFHGTIAQNLRLVSPDASDAKLRRICAEVGILETIEKLSKGFDTLLNHARQENLSDGFKQALSVAQALIREPKILLLDEPAKSLDYELESSFLDSLAKRRTNTTIIMVSHRPSHIRLADRVLSLNQGVMTSFDPPKQLEAS